MTSWHDPPRQPRRQPSTIEGWLPFLLAVALPFAALTVRTWIAGGVRLP